MNGEKFEIQPSKKFQVDYEYTTYSDETLIADVETITEGMIPDPEGSGLHLEILVEYPLLEAVKAFHNKGIKTFASSANRKDVNIGVVYVILYLDSLNENNRKIAENFQIYERQQGRELDKLVKIALPVDKETTVGDVREEFKKIVDIFEDQNQN